MGRPDGCGNAGSSGEAATGRKGTAPAKAPGQNGGHDTLTPTPCGGESPPESSLFDSVSMRMPHAAGAGGHTASYAGVRQYRRWPPKGTSSTEHGCPPTHTRVAAVKGAKRFSVCRAPSSTSTTDSESNNENAVEEEAARLGSTASACRRPATLLTLPTPSAVRLIAGPLVEDTASPLPRRAHTDSTRGQRVAATANGPSDAAASTVPDGTATTAHSKVKDPLPTPKRGRSEKSQLEFRGGNSLVPRASWGIETIICDDDALQSSDAPPSCPACACSMAATRHGARESVV